LVVLIAAGIAAWWLASHSLPPEPTYNGKSLSVWLRDLNYSHSPADRAASNAVAQIGTNALPHLGPMLRARDSALKLRFISLLQKQSLWKVSFTPSRERQMRGSAACRVLRQEARQYIPELTRLLNTPESRIAWSGFVALLDLRPRSEWPELLDGTLTNCIAQVRYCSAELLGNCIEGRVVNALPRTSTKLMTCLTDQDPCVRQCASEALVRIEDHEARQLVRQLESAHAEGPLRGNIMIIQDLESLVKDPRRLEAILMRYQASPDSLVRAQAEVALKHVRGTNGF
jgi:hypothetical protein